MGLPCTLRYPIESSLASMASAMKRPDPWHSTTSTSRAMMPLLRQAWNRCVVSKDVGKFHEDGWHGRTDGEVLFLYIYIYNCQYEMTSQQQTNKHTETFRTELRWMLSSACCVVVRASQILVLGDPYPINHHDLWMVFLSSVKWLAKFKKQWKIIHHKKWEFKV